MNAKEFNTILKKHADLKLKPLGFLPKGVHFYLYDPPNILVFYKKSVRSFYDGLYIALTHDFISNTKDEKGQLKVPTYLENYPVSISLNTLVQQYKKYNSSRDFDCDMNFLTREVLTTRSSDPYELFENQRILEDDITAEKFIDSAVDILLSDGMKFFKEFSPEISYLALTKHRKVEWFEIENFKKDLEKYMHENGVELPRHKVSWWKKLIRRNN
jgi:hypothetical protein